MKKQLEKLNEIEDLNISIGEFNSNMANKLDCLNGDILARLDETKDIIDNLPKNDYIYKFYKKLNELKESKSNVTLNWLSLATSLLGLSITILQYKPN